MCYSKQCISTYTYMIHTEQVIKPRSNIKTIYYPHLLKAMLTVGSNYLYFLQGCFCPRRYRLICLFRYFLYTHPHPNMFNPIITFTLS